MAYKKAKLNFAIFLDICMQFFKKCNEHLKHAILKRHVNAAHAAGTGGGSRE